MRKRFGTDETKLTLSDFSAREQNIYRTSDPFDIYEICNANGDVRGYEVKGIIDFKCKSADKLLEMLDCIAVANLETDLEEIRDELVSAADPQKWKKAEVKAISNKTDEFNLRTVKNYLEEDPEFAQVLKEFGIEPDFIY